jgi:hypothetical protein
MSKITFTSLTCVKRNDVLDVDEPVIRIDHIEKWSGAIHKKETLKFEPPLIEEFNGRESVLLEMLERDGVADYQLIGTKRVTAGHPDPQPVVFKTGGTHYELRYTVT